MVVAPHQVQHRPSPFDPRVPSLNIGEEPTILLTEGAVLEGISRLTAHADRVHVERMGEAVMHTEAIANERAEEMTANLRAEA